MNKGKGSRTHQRAQNLIREYFAGTGTVAVVEASVKGKSMDVMVQDIHTKEITAVEIEVCGRRCLRNCILDLKAGCSRVIVIFFRERDLKREEELARTSMGSQAYGKIRFCLFQDFIPLKQIEEKQVV